MVCTAAGLLCAVCVLVSPGATRVNSLQSSWGYRGFKVQCQTGIRSSGDALRIFPKTASRSQCLQRCFAHRQCESVSYSPESGQCYLSSSTKEISGTSEDQGFMYCGPEADEPWDRTAITVELPTTTVKPTTLEPNECESSPCQNGGVCNDGLGKFTCDCAPGYEGVTCNVDTNECSSGPCQNGGSCVDAVNRYSCTCSAGFDGVNCQINVDECSSNPCQNGGTCADGINKFTCSCEAGYAGTLCDGNINECASSPCQHGVCNDGVNSFTCTCSAGYEGTLCNTETDECASSPCRHGNCNEQVNGFTCTCSAGYEGTLCNTNINECSSSPCVYGTCNDLVNSFTCSCVSGARGTLCNIEPIRLANGPSANEGRVEVWYNGAWGTVCDDLWDMTDANVACRQLGYPYATNTYNSAAHGAGTGSIHLDDTNCAGTEISLGSCPHAGWGSHNCGHGEDASLRCFQSGSIRLVNGPLPNEGRVEVYYSGAWGTVCDDGWDINDGQVACRQLGYPSAARVWSSATHGQGTGAIHLDDLACSGSEASLGACSHSGWGNENCGHHEDASVKCNLT
ncbi:neurogenic locus Notch protein-like isoform X2 [Acanthaster planci]|uniref:Neurogenic locus Notch protein-like isoform X2 n=1 Tax=Acanthaster planci TaxID=133434 RepID=A0A8B7ZGR0_ACAPL|nr:neurogenic locus Notch protein-like isoform X2 [Acanthaster planci]